MTDTKKKLFLGTTGVVMPAAALALYLTASTGSLHAQSQCNCYFSGQAYAPGSSIEVNMSPPVYEYCDNSFGQCTWKQLGT